MVWDHELCEGLIQILKTKLFPPYCGLQSVLRAMCLKSVMLLRYSVYFVWHCLTSLLLNFSHYMLVLHKFTLFSHSLPSSYSIYAAFRMPFFSRSLVNLGHILYHTQNLFFSNYYLFIFHVHYNLHLRTLSLKNDVLFLVIDALKKLFKEYPGCVIVFSSSTSILS